MAQALYRKWRPQTFDDVVGQEHIVKTLRYALRTGHIHHAYLLAGPRGTGKTTTARLIAKAVNCLASEEERPCNECEICRAIADGRLMDLVEIDAASNTGVDNIRDLLEKVGFRPTQATYKVYVIDEVHMLSTAAFNALLKTLEEPPEHVIFVLATTEVHKIPETILSRCQRFEFRRIPLDAIVQRLDKIAEAEGVEVEQDALELIARSATGAMRDAISLFDQMAAGGSVTADYVRLMLGAERREVVRSLLEAWVAEDVTEGLRLINHAVDSGADPRQLARQTADFLRGLLLMRLGAGQMWADPTAAERPALETLARKADPDRLVEAVRRFSEVASKQRTGWQPQLPLELAFVEATLQASSLDDIAAEFSKPARKSSTSSASTASTPTASASSERTEKPARSRSAEQVRERPSTSTAAADEGEESRPRETGRSRPGASEKETSTSSSRPAAARASTGESSRSSAPARTRPPAEKAPPEEPSGATADSGATAVDTELVDKIRTHWSEIVSRVKPVTLGALLRDADVGGVDAEGRLVLTFQHTFHRERVSEASNLDKLEDSFAQLIKRRITLRCLLKDEWTSQQTGTPQPTETSQPTGASQVSEPSRTYEGSQSAEAPQSDEAEPTSSDSDAAGGEDEEALEEDELIRRAQEELGAVAKVSE